VTLTAVSLSFATIFKPRLVSSRGRDRRIHHDGRRRSPGLEADSFRGETRDIEPDRDVDCDGDRDSDTEKKSQPVFSFFLREKGNTGWVEQPHVSARHDREPTEVT
jgi:hypothetical protein